MTDTESIKNIYDPYDNEGKGIGDHDYIRYIFSEALHSETIDGIMEKEKILSKKIKVANDGQCFFEGDTIKNISDGDNALTIQQKNTINELMTYYNTFTKIGDYNKIDKGEFEEAPTLFHFNKDFYLINDAIQSKKARNHPQHLSKLFGSTYRELSHEKYMLVGNKKVEIEDATTEAEHYLFSEGMRLEFRKSPVFSRENTWNPDGSKPSKFNFAISFKHRLTNKNTTINIEIVNNDSYEKSIALRQLRRLSSAVGANWNSENKENLNKTIIKEDIGWLKAEGILDEDNTFNEEPGFYDKMKNTITFDRFEYNFTDENVDEFQNIQELLNNEKINIDIQENRSVFLDPSSVKLRVEKITDNNAVILSYGTTHPDFIKIENIPDDKFNEREEDDSFIFTGQIPTLSQLYRYANNETQQLTYKDTKLRFKVEPKEKENKIIEMDSNGCFGTKYTDKNWVSIGKFERIEDMTLDLKKIIKKSSETKKDSFLTITFGESKMKGLTKNAIASIEKQRENIDQYQLDGGISFSWNRLPKVTTPKLQLKLKANNQGKNIVRPKITTDHNIIELINEYGSGLPDGNGRFKISSIQVDEPFAEKGLLGLAGPVNISDIGTKFYKINSISQLKRIMASVKEIGKNGKHIQKYGEYFKAEAYFYKLLRFLKTKNIEVNLDNLTKKGKTLFAEDKSQDLMKNAEEIYSNYIQSKYYNVILFLRSLSTEITDYTPDYDYEIKIVKKISQNTWELYNDTSEQTKLAYDLIDEQLNALGLPGRSEEYKILTQTTKVPIEYGILFCGKIYSLKYDNAEKSLANDDKIFPEEFEDGNRFSPEKSEGANAFNKAYEAVKEGIDEPNNQNILKWYYEKVCAIYRNNLKPNDDPAQIFSLKLNDKSFESDIEDFKKVRNPTAYFKNNNKKIFNVNRFKMTNNGKSYKTVDGITIDDVDNKVYGEFGYVKFLKENGTEKGKYKLIINELSKPKITLFLEEILSFNGIKKAKKILNKLNATNKKMENWLKLIEDGIGEEGIKEKIGLQGNDDNTKIGEFWQFKNRINVKDKALNTIITSLWSKFEPDHETITQLKDDGDTLYKDNKNPLDTEEPKPAIKEDDLDKIEEHIKKSEDAISSLKKKFYKEVSRKTGKNLTPSESWKKDEEQLGFEAIAVADRNIFSNMWKSLTGALMSEYAAYDHENEFILMNMWYTEIKSEIDAWNAAGFTPNITMNFENKNFDCSGQEVSWEHDVTSRANEKIHYLFLLNQFIYVCLYELSTQYIKKNIDDDNNNEINQKFSNNEHDKYNELSNIWKFFKDKENLDFPIKTHETITVSYNGLKDLFKFGFEFSEIYPKKTTNEAGYDKVVDLTAETEVPNYSTYVDFKIVPKSYDDIITTQGKTMKQFYDERFEEIKMTFREELNEERDSKFHAKLYTIYTRRYVCIIRKTDDQEPPPVYFEAWILEDMEDGKWALESIVDWGNKGLVLNVEQKKKIFLRYEHKISQDDESENKDKQPDIGTVIIDKLRHYRFTIEDSKVLTNDNKEQHFLYKLITEIQANDDDDITMEIIKGGKCVPFKNKNKILSSFITNMKKNIKTWVDTPSDEFENKVLQLVMVLVLYMYFTLLHGNNYIDYDVLSIEQFLNAGKYFGKKTDIENSTDEPGRKLYNYMKVASGKDQYWEKMCTTEKNAIKHIVMGIEDKTDVQKLLTNRITYCAYLEEFEQGQGQDGNIEENFMDEILIPHISKSRTWKNLDSTNDRKEGGQGGEVTRAYKSQYRYYLYQDLINYMKYITVKTIMPLNHRFDCFFDKFCYLCNEIITTHDQKGEDGSIFLNKFLIKKINTKISESTS